MEHMIIEERGSGYYRLTAEDGYVLYLISTGRAYSEAVVEEKGITKFDTRVSLDELSEPFDDIEGLMESLESEEPTDGSRNKRTD